MRCLDRFNQKMIRSGYSLRDEKIRNSRELLEEMFADDASFTLGIYMWEHGIKDYSGKDTIKIRFYDRSFSNANGWTMKYQTLYDTPIVTGDVLFDSKNDEYYICTESFDIDEIHWQGKLTLCNWILKWQNKNGDILEYPCHDMNTTQYNSGERGNQQFTLGSTQHMIVLPCDQNTVVLNDPQRFFLDKNTENPTSFVVTQNDTTSYNYGKKGLVRVTLAECPTNSKYDRIDLGICDYREKEDFATDNANEAFISKSVIEYTSKIIKSGGDFQIYTAKFFDNLGNEIKGIEPYWTISCEFKDALILDGKDDWIKIGIDDDQYIDEDFKLTLTDKDNNYVSDLLISIESLL